MGVFLWFAAACDRSSSLDREQHDSRQSNDVCVNYVARRMQPSPDSLSMHDRCILASRAYAQLVSRAQPEVAAEGDAQRITRITVGSANRLDPVTDTVLEEHWVVHFSLNRRPYDIEGVADGLRSRFVLRRTEKM